MSTGCGLLGTNTFAYCNNNPINYLDENGKIPNRDFADASTFHEPRGGGPDIRKPIGIGTQSEFAKEFENLFWDTTNMNSIEDVIDVYNRVMDYEMVQDVFGANKIRTGCNKINNGIVTIVVVPDPTPLDETVGIAKIWWGVCNIVVGICELLEIPGGEEE